MARENKALAGRAKTTPDTAGEPTRVSPRGGLVFVGVLFGLMLLVIVADLLRR